MVPCDRGNGLRMRCRLSNIFAAAFLLILPPSCTQAATRNPLQFDAFALINIHRLWGGQAVFIKGDGDLWVQDFHPSRPQGHQEKRYHLRINNKDIKEFKDVLLEHNFMGMEIKDRTGHPDETRPTFKAKLKTGQRRTVAKWGDDKQPDFDAIHQWIVEKLQSLHLSERKPEYDGPYDSTWKPEGFPF